VNRTRDDETIEKCLAIRKKRAGQNTVPLYLQEAVDRTQLWRTPQSAVTEAKPEGTKLSGRTPADPQVGLVDQVLWQTPSATCAEAGATSRSGEWKDELLLGGQARQWPTPNQTDYKGPSQPEGRRPECDDDLPSAVAKTWPTPRREDSEQTGPHGEATDTLTRAARVWPTPVSNDDNKTPQAHLAMKKRMGERDGSNANRTVITSLQVMAKASAGPPAPANPSTPGKPRGSLNAAWVAQLMGFPPEYTAELISLCCEYWATLGSTRLPSKCSKQS